jgi:carboxyl-terminal processing protease
MKKFLAIGLIFVVLLVFGLGMYAGITFERNNTQLAFISTDNSSEFQLIQQAWNITQENYVDENATRPQRLAYGAISGMIDSLGDTGHSTFLTPTEVKQQNNFDQGTLEGIGIEIQSKNGNVVIVAPLSGSPAEKAGLHSGDIILKVNGLPVIDVADAVNRILGPAGTSVTLTIQDVSGVTRDVTIIRATINLVSVSWQQLPGTSIAHLQIASLTQGASAALDKALSAIKAQGNTGIILDLRGNPGGLLDEAIGVASRFLSSGNVLLEKDASGNITPDPVLRNVKVTDLPMVVLIDQGTASGAEIVAGALQDSGRAKLIGQITFGTGTVLEQFSLSDGSALLLAIQEWLTPSGRTIWHTGLGPDTVVTLATGINPLSPESEKGMTASQLQSSGDQQLLSALNMLLAVK